MRRNNPNPPQPCPHGITPKKTCRDCRAAYARAWQQSNRAYWAAYLKDYRALRRQAKSDRRAA